MTHPEQTALLEAAGALVRWDVLGEATPITEVHDEPRAAAWLWELTEDPAVLAAAHHLARLHWARSWWPASTVAGIPPLHPALLAAELALATAALSHLLDDEEATERALAELLPLPLAALTPDPALHSEAQALAEALADLADTFGHPVPEPATPTTRGHYALAAGGEGQPDGLVVQRGSTPVDWSLIPHGTLDAAAEASWTILRRGGTTVLEATVQPAPGAVPASLSATFGPVELPLDPTPSGELTGSIPLPATVLLLPASERTLTVHAPGYTATPDPAAPARRAALLAHAQSRLDDPAATLTERTARLLWTGA